MLTKRIAAIVLLIFAIHMALGRVVFLGPTPEVEYEGVIYRSTDSRHGVIQAIDSKHDSLLWEKRLYDVLVDPNETADAQWVYVEGIFLDDKNRRIIVLTDNETLFALDPKSQEVVVVLQGRGITTRVEKREEGSSEFDELQVLKGDRILKRFPSVHD